MVGFVVVVIDFIDVVVLVDVAARLTFASPPVSVVVKTVVEVSISTESVVVYTTEVDVD